MTRSRPPYPPPASTSFSDSEPEEISADSSDRDPDEVPANNIIDMHEVTHDDHDEVIHMDASVGAENPLPKTREELKAYVTRLKNEEIRIKEEQRMEMGIRIFFILTMAFKTLYTLWTLSLASLSNSLNTSGLIYIFFVTVFMWLSTGMDWAIWTLFKENRQQQQQLLVLSRSGLIHGDKKLRLFIVAKIVILFLTLLCLIRGIQGGNAPTPLEFIFPLYLYVFSYGGLSLLIGLVWLQYKMRTAAVAVSAAAPASNVNGDGRVNV